MINFPKRKRDKDNPYVLLYSEETNSYMVKFKDSRNVIQIVEISTSVFEAFNKFELDDISQMHKIDKHIEHSEIYEEKLYTRALNKPQSIENIVERKILISKIFEIIESLPIVQQRRIKMYYIDELSLKEIAKIEKCSFQAVNKSINLALKKIKI